MKSTVPKSNQKYTSHCMDHSTLSTPLLLTRLLTSWTHLSLVPTSFTQLSFIILCSAHFLKLFEAEAEVKESVLCLLLFSATLRFLKRLLCC
jgi:hypothetical protein